MAYTLVKFQYALIQQNPSTEALVVPTSAQIYYSDNITLATVYKADGTTLTNSPSVPSGVAIGSAGIDTVGNLVWWGDPTHDYSVLFAGSFLPVPTSSIHHKDVTNHFDGTTLDPHGDRAWALAQFVSQGDTTTLTGALGNAGLVRF